MKVKMINTEERAFSSICFLNGEFWDFTTGTCLLRTEVKLKIKVTKRVRSDEDGYIFVLANSKKDEIYCGSQAALFIENSLFNSKTSNV